MQFVEPVANGLSTDHPAPELPFVDDSHIPTRDPKAIEEIGRRAGDGLWGRLDWTRTGDELADSPWWAFTTDPTRPDLAWCVRHHPEHGRSVVLVRNGDAGLLHEDWGGEALLFRHGGYWWDGQTWFRPAQLWDGAAQRFVHRTVPEATTVTADKALFTGLNVADLAGGRILDVTEFDTGGGPPTRWEPHLAAWAGRRSPDARPLSRCVVTMRAPELAVDQLVNSGYLATLLDMQASSLRTRKARGEIVLPTAQRVISGRRLYSRAVAEDFAEALQRGTDSTAQALAHRTSQAPPGVHELREKLRVAFFERLWRPVRRNQWVRRARTKESVGEVADELAATVALKLDQIIPMSELAGTIRAAVLQQFITDPDLSASNDSGRIVVAVNWKIATMLGWLVRHDPAAGQHTVTTIIGDGERIGVPRASSIAALRDALEWKGQMTEDELTEFWRRATPPSDDSGAA
ncbi:MAG: hypothetical protein H5T78_08770 [Nocardia sp.]|nr:hypothetical protein [Nocardia sp.]